MPNGDERWSWKNLPPWVHLILSLLAIVALGAIAYSQIQTNTEHRVMAEKRLEALERRMSLAEAQLATMTKLDDQLQQQGKDVVQIRILVERMAEKLESVAAQVAALRDDRRRQ